jgi:hypothetical protein
MKVFQEIILILIALKYATSHRNEVCDNSWSFSMLLPEDEDLNSKLISQKFEDDLIGITEKFELDKKNTKEIIKMTNFEIKTINEKLKELQTEVDNKARELNITELSEIVGNSLNENQKLFFDLQKLDELQKEAKNSFFMQRKYCWKNPNSYNCDTSMRTSVSANCVKYQKIRKEISDAINQMKINQDNVLYLEDKIFDGENVLWAFANEKHKQGAALRTKLYEANNMIAAKKNYLSDIQSNHIELRKKLYEDAEKKMKNLKLMWVPMNNFDGRIYSNFINFRFRKVRNFLIRRMTDKGFEYGEFSEDKETCIFGKLEVSVCEFDVS